jgi:hypothetical protein
MTSQNAHLNSCGLADRIYDINIQGNQTTVDVNFSVDTGSGVQDSGGKMQLVRESGGWHIDESEGVLSFG